MEGLRATSGIRASTCTASGRLIIHGTWFGLGPAGRNSLSWRSNSYRHAQLRSMAAWKIDVKKASAQLPPPVRDRLRRIIEPLRRNLKDGHSRTRGRRLVEREPRIPVWSRTPEQEARSTYRINR